MLTLPRLHLVTLVSILAAIGTCANALHIRHDATPIRLPFVRRVNMTGVPSIIKQDQARAGMLKSRALAGSSMFQQEAVFDVPATNQAVDYVTTVCLVA